MEHEISTGVGIALVIFFVIAVAAIALMILAMVKNVTNAGATQLQGSVSQILDSRFDDYDQTLVPGSRVKSAIKLFEGADIGVVVKTSADRDGKNSPAANGRNYGAMLLTGTTFNSAPTQTASSTHGIDYQLSAPISKAAEGDAYYTAMFKRDASNQLEYNYNVRPLSTSGYSAYIRDSASFRATLILDTSGTKIGVYFEQIN